MSDQPEFHIEVEPSMEAYRKFWTSAAAEQLWIRSENAPKLLKLVKVLLLNWRAISYGAAMPEQFVLAGKAALDTFRGSGGNTELLDIAPKIVNGLAAMVPDMVNEEGLARRLEQSAIVLGAKFQEQRFQDTDVYPVDEAWQEHLKKPVFQMYIWSSQRLCYQGVYNAYDDFVKQCIRTILNLRPEDELAPKDPRLGKTFIANFGKASWDKCWMSKEIKEVRMHRHSLTHSSGRITPKMRAANINIEDIDDVIQIRPHRIRNLYKLLAPYALEIIDKAVVMPCFA
ncbi:MAG: hypothetical protein WD669_08770 [Pirellulales bacterium]